MSSGNFYDYNLMCNDESEPDNLEDYDCFNDETFGDGAVEDDWEMEHKHFADASVNQLKSDVPDMSRMTNSLLADDDDSSELLDKSDHLTQAVERLLYCEPDQEAIDPAIVSLKKQPPQASTPQSKFNFSKSANNFPPLFGSDTIGLASDDFFNKISGLQKKPIEDSWLFSKLNNNNLPLSSSSSLIFNNNNISNTQTAPSPKLDVQFEDEAIVTAVKDLPPAMKLRQQPLILKAEDLEKNLQNHTPTFHNDSLPASMSSLSMDPIEPHTMGSMSTSSSSSQLLKDLMSKQQKRHTPPPQQNQSNLPQNEQVLKHPGPRILPPPPPPGVPPPHIMMEMGPGMFAPNFIFPRGMMVRPPPTHPSHHQHHHQQHQQMMRNVGRPRHPPSNSPFPMPPVYSSAQMAAQAHMAAQMMSNYHLRGIPPPHLPPHPFGANPHHHMNFVRMQQQQQQPPTSILQPPHRGMSGGQMGPAQLHPEHCKFLQSRQLQRRYGRSPTLRNNGRHWKKSDDPFANLMTTKEKDWVIRIQMMALQSDRPEIDDYYYQNYIDRRLKDGGYSADNGDGPQRLITPTNPNIEGRKYVPVQFQNSLGKLTTSSVYNPRQIIEITEDETPENEGPESRQTLSKRLVIYKTIEKAYDLLILIEEMIRNEKADQFDQRGVPVVGKNIKDIDKKLDEMAELCLGSDDVDMLSFDAHADHVFQLMKIRKGKKLIMRLIPYLLQEQRNFVLQSITAHLGNLVKRDAKDKILLEMFRVLVNIIENLNAFQMLIIVAPLTCFALATALRDQVGASFVFKLLLNGSALFGINENDNHSQILETDQQLKWTKFVCDVTEVVVTVANPKTSRHSNHTTVHRLLMHENVEVEKIVEILHSRSSSRDRASIEKSLKRLIACGHQ